jgi:hypothetical protein
LPIAPDFLHGERAHVEEREDAAARAGLAALELPRERADDAAGVEHALDVAVHVIGVDAALGGSEIVTSARAIDITPMADLDDEDDHLVGDARRR